MYFPFCVAVPLPAAEVAARTVTDPYGHFCPDVDPVTQSPISITSISAVLRSPAQPLNMSWTDNLLDEDPATNQILLPGPLSVELAETTIYLNVPPNTYFLDHEGRNYTMVQVREGSSIYCATMAVTFFDPHRLLRSTQANLRSCMNLEQFVLPTNFRVLC